jgi:hypothetical protein
LTPILSGYKVFAGDSRSENKFGNFSIPGVVEVTNADTV